MTFGFPEEQQEFQERNPRFVEVLPAFKERIDQVVSREFMPANLAQRIVFGLGKLAAEDFMEILLNCANGYGMAGLKLLRPMFEVTVTAMYLARHEDEVEQFMDYHYVHQRKSLMIAADVGADLGAIVTEAQRRAVEEAYQAVRPRYRQVICAKCQTERELASWSKKDLMAMAREVNLGRAALGLYFLPTLQIHTTPTRLLSRLEETGEGLRFKVGAQPIQADRAMMGAHVCMALLLEDLNRYLRLGIGDLEVALRDGVAHAWPTVRPKGEEA